jgi:CheY-like chemotaxis protein
MERLTHCRKLREEAEKQRPALMLTARDTRPDKLTGFDADADDYLIKPFALEEFLARVFGQIYCLIPKLLNSPPATMQSNPMPYAMIKGSPKNRTR